MGRFNLTNKMKAILPKKFPNRKILSIDIGGTLAKTAFYIPNEF